MNDDEAPESDECPECGEPIHFVTVTGPEQAIISPCGHRVNPERLRE